MAELLEEAAAQGIDLTAEKLHRWRKAGVMPSPKSRHHGRLGTESIYPSIALDQALMIGTILTHTRDLDVVRWRLFVKAFPVSMQSLRDQLGVEVARLIGEKEEVLTASDPSEEADETAERYRARLTRKARARGGSPGFRRLRELLGRIPITNSLDLAERLGTGAYTDLEPNDREILSRAFPQLEAAGLIHAGALATFSQLVDPGPVAAAFHKADEATLLLARDELPQVAEVLRRALDMSLGLGPAIALEAERDSSWPWPILFLYWLRYRENPQIRLALTALHAELNPFTPITPNADRPLE
ncbi:MAG: hypothetical protein H0U66_06095 [Gemmatimonadaceae bacterium]|nr:hypothetical protein [Gemmatimonadaceae bacterium]